MRACRFHEYARESPAANDFYDEIDWLVWACYGFLSTMEKSPVSHGNDTRVWLLRELDLAVTYTGSRPKTLERSLERDIPFMFPWVDARGAAAIRRRAPGRVLVPE